MRVLISDRFLRRFTGSLKTRPRPTALAAGEQEPVLESEKDRPCGGAQDQDAAAVQETVSPASLPATAGGMPAQESNRRREGPIANEDAANEKKHTVEKADDLIQQECARMTRQRLFSRSIK